ncbi:MAG: multicopper oxidase domain-containing protein [Calditrichaeota bacterium]|nr:multicopper oxidase domain-containing protein [Calditrichota bacterium]MCB0286851.1 multicopper oxidase domain-containing protein [Calditrichota bacterium]
MLSSQRYLYKKSILRVLLLPVYVIVFLFVMSDIQAQTLDPSLIPKFAKDMPVIQDLGLRIDLTNGANLDVTMEETEQDLLGIGLMTKVWGYKFPQIGVPTYPGATIVAKRDVPVQIEWQNKLPMRHLLPVDMSLHMARPNNGIATVTHLHGGHTESASDGLPEAWFTQDFAETGPTFVKQRYFYANDQEAATLWYHDHALGITRLNVYAGLAGFYLLRDDNELNLVNTGVLPADPYEIEIVIQGRMFDENGQLFFPAYPGDPAYDDFITGEGAVLPPEIFPGGGPTALAEFFGDVILVNGQAWPKLEVEPRKYRFRLLNGSDSRFYILKLENNGAHQPFQIIGTDDALLPNAVTNTELLFAPGERYDVVVDFSNFEGQSLILENWGGDEPFKGFTATGELSDGEGGTIPPSDPATTGRIMKFNVSKTFDTNYAEASVETGTSLRPAIEPLVQDGATRNLVLFEGMDEFGRLQPLLGTMDKGSQAWFEPITENPMLNDVEVWEVYNTTADAHPIHLHLVSFQILDRRPFEGEVEEKPQPMHDGSFGIGGKLVGHSIEFTGPAEGPDDHEAGWKDTAVMLPGQVTRVIAKFDRPGRYVWHCHILSHEDHEMMRPFHVGPQYPLDFMLHHIKVLLADPSTPSRSRNDLQDAKAYIEEAIAEYNDGDYENTYEALRDAVDNVDSAIRRGANAMHVLDGLMDIARAIATSALNNAQIYAGNPDVDALIELAESLLASGDNYKSNGKFEKAIKKYAAAWENAATAVQLGTTIGTGNAVSMDLDPVITSVQETIDTGGISKKAKKDLQKTIRALEKAQGDFDDGAIEDGYGELENAIGYLEDAENHGATVGHLIENLLSLSREYADANLMELMVYAGSPEVDDQITKSQNYLSDGDDFAANGKNEKAIDRYGKAWAEAQEGLDIVNGLGKFANDPLAAIPTEYILKQNYPNPFNPETTIQFGLPADNKVTLAVYNLSGQLVRNLINNDVPAGQHQVVWDGTNEIGDKVASGIYIYRLKAGTAVQSRKMLLLK